MSTIDMVGIAMLGLILVGIPIYLVARVRKRQQQRKLEVQAAKPANTFTVEQHRQLVKNIPKLLFIIGGVNILFSIPLGTIESLAPRSIVAIITGIGYIVLGFGARRKSKLALALSLPIFAIERIFSLVSNATVKGWDWTSCVSGGFAFLIIMILWQGIQSIRAVEKEEEQERFI